MISTSLLWSYTVSNPGFRSYAHTSDTNSHAGGTRHACRCSTALNRYGIEISLARRGHPWENGYAERLIRTLKEEEVHLNDDEDITEARERIGHFITQVYHLKRPHSALTQNLVLTLRNCGLNKRMHYTTYKKHRWFHGTD